MIELRRAETDADLEAWRRVRAAVLPNERAASVEEMRRMDTDESLRLLAELDGQLAGSGLAARSDLGGAGFVAPRVFPHLRRRGVGTALLGELIRHVESLGFDAVNVKVEDSGSRAFAERLGFREVDREVEQVRVVVDDEPAPRVPDGVEIVTVAERRDLWTAAYETLAAQAFLDMAFDSPVENSLEQWETVWLTDPAASFVAVAEGEPIGCAGLNLDADFPERAENALTAVRRDWRHRGIATALKMTALAWAAEHGIREVYTWTQRGNDAMRSLNERLGYVTRTESISMRAKLPL